MQLSTGAPLWVAKFNVLAELVAMGNRNRLNGLASAATFGLSSTIEFASPIPQRPLHPYLSRRLIARLCWPKMVPALFAEAQA